MGNFLERTFLIWKGFHLNIGTNHINHEIILPQRFLFDNVLWSVLDDGPFYEHAFNKDNISEINISNLDEMKILAYLQCRIMSQNLPKSYWRVP